MSAWISSPRWPMFWLYLWMAVYASTEFGGLVFERTHSWPLATVAGLLTEAASALFGGWRLLQWVFSISAEEQEGFSP